MSCLVTMKVEPDLIAVEDLIERNLMILKKFTKVCEKSFTCFPKFFTLKWQIVYSVVFAEPLFPPHAFHHTFSYAGELLHDIGQA